MYSVKEIFYTLQGEGANVGRPAVFCRFTGCNLWSGHEADRVHAICQFCDTDFVGSDGTGGGKFTNADELAAAIVALWPDATAHPFIVCTGGEPLLQLDDALLDALHHRRCIVAIETNGTLPVPSGVDWVCVSPKAGALLEVRSGNELKLVFPQHDLDPDQLMPLRFDHFFLQPMDGPARAENTARAIDYCLTHPMWRLSVQTHKVLGLR